MTSTPSRGHDHIQELIERSSLGEPGAVRLRRRTSHELADAIVGQADHSFYEQARREHAQVLSGLRSGRVTLTWVLDHATADHLAQTSGSCHEVTCSSR
jgi:hypothetical protein